MQARKNNEKKKKKKKKKGKESVEIKKDDDLEKMLTREEREVVKAQGWLRAGAEL